MSHEIDYAKGNEKTYDLFVIFKKSQRLATSVVINGNPVEHTTPWFLVNRETLAKFKTRRKWIANDAKATRLYKHNRCSIHATVSHYSSIPFSDPYTEAIEITRPWPQISIQQSVQCLTGDPNQKLQKFYHHLVVQYHLFLLALRTSSLECTLSACVRGNRIKKE